MLHHFLLPKTVEEMRVGVQGAMMVVRQETANDGFSIHFVLSGGRYLHPIAAGENHPLADTLAMHEIGDGVSEVRCRDVHLLPDLHRRRAMIDAQKGEIQFETWDTGVGTRESGKSLILAPNPKAQIPSTSASGCTRASHSAN